MLRSAPKQLKDRLKGGGCSTNGEGWQHGQQRQKQQQRHLQREGEELPAKASQMEKWKEMRSD
jgi:hypothetical protein